jgi:leader peptidase (prepilin peptidase)/N-methyltransferase
MVRLGDLPEPLTLVEPLERHFASRFEHESFSSGEHADAATRMVMSTLYVAGVVILGLVAGSFVNVLAYRNPLGRSVAEPKSACPRCGHPIRPRDNVPIVSWLLLRGRCRDCREPISIQYPVVESTTGLLFGLMGAVIGLNFVLPAFLWFVGVTMAILLVDIHHQRIPNSILIPGGVVGLVLLGVGSVLESQASSFVRGLAGGLVGFGLFLLLALVTRGGFGMGDVKLAALVSIFTAYVSWVIFTAAILGSFLIGGSVALALLLRGSKGRKDRVAFGPFLIVSGWLVILCVNAIALGI